MCSVKQSTPYLCLSITSTTCDCASQFELPPFHVASLTCTLCWWKCTKFGIVIHVCVCADENMELCNLGSEVEAYMLSWVSCALSPAAFLRLLSPFSVLCSNQYWKHQNPQGFVPLPPQFHHHCPLQMALWKWRTLLGSQVRFVLVPVGLGLAAEDLCFNCIDSGVAMTLVFGVLDVVPVELAGEARLATEDSWMLACTDSGVLFGVLSNE